MTNYIYIDSIDQINYHPAGWKNTKGYFCNEGLTAKYEGRTYVLVLEQTKEHNLFFKIIGALVKFFDCVTNSSLTENFEWACEVCEEKETQYILLNLEGEKVFWGEGLDKQYAVGEAYYKERSYKEAAHWYQLAAKKGYHLAQYMLGVLYEDGKGVNKDEEKAFKLYQKAAKHYCYPAIGSLQHCYTVGIGTEVHLEMAQRCQERMDAQDSKLQINTSTAAV